MEESNEINLLKDENVTENVKEEVLNSVKEKTDRNSWGYAVGFGTVITFVSVIIFYSP